MLIGRYSFQNENGWFDCCCLDKPDQPLTHTIGYNLRGLIEAYRLSEESKILKACEQNANGILSAIQGKWVSAWPIKF